MDAPDGLQRDKNHAMTSPSMRSITRLPYSAVCLALALSVVSSRVPAQCTHSWEADSALAGVYPQSINDSALWDPDGAGPMTPVIVAVGGFEVAGGEAARYAAIFDPATATWSRMGEGLDGYGQAVVAVPGGNVYVGGEFTTAGGVVVNHIACWDGTSWSSLGAGMDGSVWALDATPGGDVVAFGSFQNADGAPASRIAKWDGSSWSAFGTGLNMFTLQPGSVRALSNGDVIVSGAFSIAGGSPVASIARWDGTSWSAMGSGLNHYANAILEMPNGDVMVAGRFSQYGYVALWNGTSWSQVGNGLGDSVYDLIHHGGHVVACGSYSGSISRWNGVSWQPLSGGSYGWFPKTLIELPDSNLVAAGYFDTIGGVSANGIARWNGASWAPMNDDASGPVHALEELSDGDLVVGGGFHSFGGAPARNLARQSQGVWSSMGDPNGPVYTLRRLANGDLIVGGAFTNIGGVPVANVARWDGANWWPLGTGLSSSAHAIAEMPSGDLMVGGNFLVAGGVLVNGIARWDGSAWSSIGAQLNSRCEALAVLPNGDLVAAGHFTTVGGIATPRIARWDGTSWHSMGGLSGNQNRGVRSLAVLPNGDLVAGGNFSNAGGVSVEAVARWNGTAWGAMGGGLPGFSSRSVHAMVVLPNGDIVAGGTAFTLGGQTVYRLARWDGSAWSAFTAGVTFGSFVNALHLSSAGELHAGGFFGIVDNDVVAGNLARIVPSCPATAVVQGVGCAGTGNLNELTADNLPWVGSTFTATASGLPAQSFAFAITGLGAASLPLGAVLPVGAAGCQLLATPDAIELVLPVAGSAQTQFVIPNHASLVRATVYQQVAALAVDAQLALVELTSTNALEVSVGAF